VPSEAFNEVVSFIRSTATDATLAPTFEQARTQLDALGAMFAVPEGVEITPVEIGGVSCERYDPTGATGNGLLMYVHGGAYTGGSLVSHRSLVARLAVATGREVVAVDYRLAPEHPFPSALDDVVAVYRRLVSDGGQQPDDLVLAGDSAGGGLATALLLRLRDEGDPLPSGAVLLSPWLDLTLTADAITTVAGDDPMLTAGALARSAAAYADVDLRNPLVSPVYADPTGLPPLLVLVGTAEILVDDSRSFAERAAAAGVHIDLDVEDGMIHVWPFIDGIPESVAALDRIGAWVRDRAT
jgi:epsilon-lactone hydrolase